MKRICALAVALVALAAPVAVAHSSGTLSHRANHLRTIVIKKLGAHAAGRDIIRQGCRGRSGVVHQCSKHQKAKYLRELRRLAYPPRYPSLVRTAVPPSQAPAGTATASVAAGGELEKIAMCESHGDPGAISPDGKYRGKYQFDYRTWQEVGGSGDPAAAPEAEQDQRAAMLLQRAGPGRWPNCG